MNRWSSIRHTLAVAVAAGSLVVPVTMIAAQQPPQGQPVNQSGQQPAGQKPPGGPHAGQRPGTKMAPGQGGQKMGPAGQMGQRPPGGPGNTMGGPPNRMGQRPPGRGQTPGGPQPFTKPGTPAPGALAAASPPRVHRRGVDPFRVPWSVPPPPPYVFDDILPVRVADEDVEPPPVTPVTIREQPALRVSGIMTGDGVFAILEEGGGKVDIVKPGSSVDIGVSGGSRTYRVASIKDDTVVLQSVEGNTTYEQVVPLSDAPIGTTPGNFGTPGGFGNRPGGFGAPNTGGPGMRPGGKGGAGAM